ncbi:glycoside hydrolase family 1 protein [Faecalicoccus pleomorphus]|uniref:glycoside hydrolase family 1 protein n=2 Tax=Faecalicoccus pleomorphus TaxID=1323 RepID=UPI0022E02177|nr:glycoside hydrolase family 1 protein [Faecalicoccus pleomorphus]MDM8292669.1 glycoside hydrolase family 1 protein [Faecalicoccus pleomorphus]
MESLEELYTIQDSFSDDFLWGVAFSAKQTEGSFDRGITVADLQDYNPKDSTKVKGDLSESEILNRLENPSNYYFPKEKGIDFYHRYKEDLELIAKLGVKCLRFSISWARIFPNDDEIPSQVGLDFYDSILQILNDKGITPIITLYHDDMPVRLALEYNGFLSKYINESFIRYAQLILTRYKGKVNHWIIFNQINLTRVGLSSLGIVKDKVTDLEAAKWQAVHNKMVTAAKIVSLGREISKDFRFGSMLADFIVNPETCEPKDIVFATEKNQMTMFLYADVQFFGEYPGYALRYFKENNICIQSDKNELKVLKENTMDFLAISYYNSNVVSAKENSMKIGDSKINPYLEANPWGWTINPRGLYDSFIRYWDRYHKPLMIAENGFGAIETKENDMIDDQYRIQYLNDHLYAIKKAIRQGVNVFAYCLWSPFDIVSSGTSEMKKRYGLIFVDQDDFGKGSGNRFPKKSYYWYQNVIQTNGDSLESFEDDFK